MVVAYVDSVMRRSGWHLSIQADLWGELDETAARPAAVQYQPQVAIRGHVVVTLWRERRMRGTDQ